MLLVKGSEWIPKESQELMEKLEKNSYLNGVEEKITPITIDDFGKENRIYVIKNLPNVQVLAETRASRNADEF